MTPPLRATLYAFSGGRAVLGATVAHALAIGTLYGVFIALNAAPLSAIGGREQSLEILSSRIGVSALAAGAFYFLLAAPMRPRFCAG